MLRQYYINVIVEIPQGGETVKYSSTRRPGRLFRRCASCTPRCSNPGITVLCRTPGAGWRPIDVLLVGPVSAVPGAVVAAAGIGALMMED